MAAVGQGGLHAMQQVGVSSITSSIKEAALSCSAHAVQHVPPPSDRLSSAISIAYSAVMFGGGWRGESSREW